MITLWHSTDGKSLVSWILANTLLGRPPIKSDLRIRRLFESDRKRDFHTLPIRIKEILYLDQPDIILTKTIDNHEMPFASIEVTEEAGSGHDPFQRFGRVAAAAERGVTAMYVLPKAVWVPRTRGNVMVGTWDLLNPTIFLALERLMSVQGVPALAYYFPDGYAGDKSTPPPRGCTPKGLRYQRGHPKCPLAADPEMQQLFGDLNEAIKRVQRMPPSQVGASLLHSTSVQARRTWMGSELHSGLLRKPPGSPWAPYTSCIEIETHRLLKHLGSFAGRGHDFGEMLTSREKTVIYQIARTGNKVEIRADPYAGSAAALDYLECGRGKTYEEREKNLVLAWGSVTKTRDSIEVHGRHSVDLYVDPIRDLYLDKRGPVKLGKTYAQLRHGHEIPRYMMQVRFGTMFTKNKASRMFAYIADALLFSDGCLWRES